MKKLIFCTFILLMFLLPATSFADMHPPSPCRICSSCVDCSTGTVNLEGRCSICSSCGDFITSECNFRKCYYYCAELCSDCETNKYSTEPGCEECHTLCKNREEYDVTFTCSGSDISRKCKKCVDNCADCKTNKYKKTPECEECSTSLCRYPNIEMLCQFTNCESLCADNCFDCKTRKFKDVPECKDCIKSCDEYVISHRLETICDVGTNIDWCAYHCFDCKTNSRTSSSLYCATCNYTIEELKNQCAKADETRRADNSQPQANAEQPQANAEQPQANAEQPQAEEAYNMRKPRVLCSAVPNIPPSIPIACLLMLLISLGLLIHLRRMEK